MNMVPHHLLPLLSRTCVALPFTNPSILYRLPFTTPSILYHLTIYYPLYPEHGALPFTKPLYPVSPYHLLPPSILNMYRLTIYYTPLCPVSPYHLLPPPLYPVSPTIYYPL